MAVFQYMIDALSLGSLYALAALGIGLIFGVLRLINFAHGDFISFGVFVLIVPSTDAAARMFVGLLPTPLLIIAVLGLVILLGLLSEYVVFRWLRKAEPSTLMVGSFALGFVIQYTLLLLYGSRPKAVSLWPDLSLNVELGSLSVPLLQIVTIGVTLSLMIALTAFLKKTSYGIQMRAAAEDFEMARLLGVNANRVISLAFALSALLAGVISLLFVCQTGMASIQMGVPLMLFAFIATVIGGMGSLAGAVLGGFLVGGMSVFLQVVLPPDVRAFRDAFVFLAVVLILLFRPQGIIKVRGIIERI